MLSLPQASPGAQTTSKPVTAQPGPVPTPVGGVPTSPTPGIHVVGGGSSPTDIFEPAPKPYRPLAAENPTSGLNLVGKLETWQVKPATRVKNITVTILEATGAQVDALLKKLPDGMVYGLHLDAEDDAWPTANQLPKVLDAVIVKTLRNDMHFGRAKLDRIERRRFDRVFLACKPRPHGRLIVQGVVQNRKDNRRDS